MSALLAQAQATFTFNGANVHLQCASAEELLQALAKFGVATAANEAPGKPAATAPAGKPASQAAERSAPSAAAAAAGEQGNVPASTPTQASAQPAASGSAPAGEQGNAAAGKASPETAAASTASSSAPAASREVSFDELKKAFLALAATAGGRAKCEAVLQPFKVARLSEAKPEQYAAVLDAIEKAAK